MSKAPLVDTSGVINVLIVDDSVTMRRLIRNGLSHDPRIKVVAEAGTAAEARDIIKRVPIDLVTLDVEMPGMDGLEFLERLMRLHPMPVIMFSSLTARHSQIALKALSLGAVECVEKPKFGGARTTFDRLADLICAVGRPTFQTADRPLPKLERRKSRISTTRQARLVLIGSSTGGVEALERVFSGFPENCPPTLVTQHMPPQFLASFSSRLDASIAPDVRLARDGDLVRDGQILFAPGGKYHLKLSGSSDKRLTLVESPKRNGHRPSVDVLFESAIPFASEVVAVMLTGMGRDGAQAMARLKSSGADCVAQDQATSVVFGMPKAAHELGAVDRFFPIDDIADRVLDLAMGRNRQTCTEGF